MHFSCGKWQEEVENSVVLRRWGHGCLGREAGFTQRPGAPSTHSSVHSKSANQHWKYSTTGRWDGNSLIKLFFVLVIQVTQEKLAKLYIN